MAPKDPNKEKDITPNYDLPINSYTRNQPFFKFVLLQTFCGQFVKYQIAEKEIWQIMSRSIGV